jgi:hypothetical protein
LHYGSILEGDFGKWVILEVGELELFSNYIVFQEHYWSWLKGDFSTCVPFSMSFGQWLRLVSLASGGILD